MFLQNKWKRGRVILCKKSIRFGRSVINLRNKYVKYEIINNYKHEIILIFSYSSLFPTEFFLLGKLKEKFNKLKKKKKSRRKGKKKKK